jgi:hypothetical protein
LSQNYTRNNKPDNAELQKMMRHVESIFFSVSKRLVEGQQKKTVECVTIVYCNKRNRCSIIAGAKNSTPKKGQGLIPSRKMFAAMTTVLANNRK